MMPKGSKEFWLAHLALLAANLIYGLNYSIAKDAMPTYIQPSGFVLLRVVGASALFIALISRSNKPKLPQKKDLLLLVACALFGVVLNQLLFFEGLNLTTPINAAVIMTVNPILVLIMAALVLRESLRFKRIFGVLLGLTGALIMIFFSNGIPQNINLSSETFLGDTLVFINAAAYALYLVLVKPLTQKYNAVSVITWVFVIGLMFVIPVGYSELMAVNWNSLPLDIWLKIAFVVVATTFLTYLFNMYSLQRLSPAVVSIYIYSQPLLASVISMFRGQDELNSYKITSAIFIFVGVFLASMPRKRIESKS